MKPLYIEIMSYVKNGKRRLTAVYWYDEYWMKRAMEKVGNKNTVVILKVKQ